MRKEGIFRKLFASNATIVIMAGMILTPEAMAAGKGKDRALLGGIVFPNLNQAVFVNPAALNPQKGRALQATYTPPLTATQNDLHDYDLSFASSSKDFGAGIGYLGTYQNGTMTHGMYAAGSFSISDLSLGVGLEEQNLDDTESAGMYAGLNYAVTRDLNVSVVGRDLTSSSPMLSAGFGWEKRGKYNLEVNVDLPALDQLSSSAYVVSLIGGLYAGRFGAQFTTRYFVDTDTYDNSVTGLVSPTDDLDIMATIDIGATTTYRFTVRFSF